MQCTIFGISWSRLNNKDLVTSKSFISEYLKKVDIFGRHNKFSLFLIMYKWVLKQDSESPLNTIHSSKNDSRAETAAVKYVRSKLGSKISLLR